MCLSIIIVSRTLFLRMSAVRNDFFELLTKCLLRNKEIACKASDINNESMILDHHKMISSLVMFMKIIGKIKVILLHCFFLSKAMICLH